MNTTMIDRRRTETAKRVYELQAERLEHRRQGRAVEGTEDERNRAMARAIAVDAEYLRALESYFIDSEVLLTGAAGRSAA